MNSIGRCFAYVARIQETRNACSILVGKPVVRKWDNNIKMDLREICCEDGRWMELAQDRVQWRALVLAMIAIYNAKVTRNTHKLLVRKLPREEVI
jgi:hypothetical protein